jgi:hypothetical protein
MAWDVANIRDAETSPDRDTVAAAFVMVTRGDEERNDYVEFAGTAAAAGRSFDPRSAVRDYLEDDEPPRHLIVTTTGSYPPE